MLPLADGAARVTTAALPGSCLFVWRARRPGRRAHVWSAGALLHWAAHPSRFIVALCVDWITLPSDAGCETWPLPGSRRGWIFLGTAPTP